MYLSELRLWNFRKYGKKGSSNTPDFLNKPHLTVPFKNGLNVLIGENDSGKTAIIDAIKLALKTHAYEWIRVQETDFYKKESKLRIELDFKGLTLSEASNFTEWLGLNEEKKSLLRVLYQVEINEGRILPSDVRAGMDGYGHILNAEAREYLKVTYLKALRDADKDLTAKKNSRLSQILQEHKLFKMPKGGKHPFEDKFKIINNDIENWFEGTNSEDEKDTTAKKNEIKDKVDQFLQKFIRNETKSSFTLGEPKIKNILEKISLGVNNESNLGLGSMNRLYMAAELLHLKREWNGLKLCLIEELEAHLHPQAQMKIINALQNERQEQFILTTHSPNLASKVLLENMIMCKDKEVFPLARQYTKLDKKDYKYLERFLDVTKSNLFFSKGVIIVEGWSEEILIPAIAKQIGIDLTEKEVSIVNVASTAYLHFANVFLRDDDKTLNIPVSIITDLDNKPNGDSEFDEEDTGKRKESINKAKEHIENSCVKLFVAKEWTLEWCLLKSSIIGSLFKEAVSSVHSRTDQFKKNNDKFDDAAFENKLIEKLKKKSLHKTEVAYRLAQSILAKDIDLSKPDEYIIYLADAIKHACDINENKK